ncbi:POU domain, class 6, transcription factor 2-like [Anguilla anguilla]|uniref:POU domain, class 6, transcription factor 2-like n=1 Tax=Anguilla anguilla TaxID=7936 RepID=UPI0015B2CCB8|nr:POU domain, class 6, transcription factor 2-like [Anguilla anguilla]
MITGQLGKPALALPPEMSDADPRGAGGDHHHYDDDDVAGDDGGPDTPDSERSEPRPPEPEDSDGGEDRDRHRHRPAKPRGIQGNLSQRERPDTPTEQNQLKHSYPSFAIGPQHLLSAQQLASAVAGVVPGAPPCLNQPVLLPFNMAGQLSGQQGLLLTMPSTSLANLQGLMAAAAAGGIMTLPLQNLQATSSLNSHLQHMQKLQQLQHQHQQQHQRQQHQQHLQQQQQQQQQRLQYQHHLQQQKHLQQHQHQGQQQQHHVQRHQQHQGLQQHLHQQQHQGQQHQHHLQHQHQRQQHQQHLPQQQQRQQHLPQQQQHQRHLPQQQQHQGQQQPQHLPQQQQGQPHQSLDQHHPIQPQLTPPDQQRSPSSSSSSLSSSQELRKPSPSHPGYTSPHHRQTYSPTCGLTTPLTPPSPLQLNSLSNQTAAAAAAAIGSLGVTQPFGATIPGLQGVGAQLVTNAQGQIIGTIPLIPNSAGPPNQAGGGASGLPVQPITPQLLTNAQGQIIATVIGNQILPVINTQGITLSPVKPGQQVQQGQVGPVTVSLHQRPHGQASVSQSPVHQASSASSSPSSSAALSVGQLVNNPTGGPGEVEGVNLDEIREFAKAFKIRRLSLGLTQTQVGQALSAAEGPAYSQSAICRHTILRGHFLLPQEAQEGGVASGLSAKLNPGLLYPARFEKLDITPKSAQKIKPVLERWMAEAEARHRAGACGLSDFIAGEPSKKRKRRTSFTPQALEVLNGHFERNTHPSGQEMTAIAEALGYDREVVRVWFCNKRQALKNTVKRLKPAELDSAVAAETLADALLGPLDERP